MIQRLTKHVETFECFKHFYFKELSVRKASEQRPTLEKQIPCRSVYEAPERLSKRA